MQAKAEASYQSKIKEMEDERVEKVCIWTPDKDLAQCVRGTRVVQLNRRTRTVLDEALDPRTPLLERLKFFCIVSSNLDEFFEVRVAGIKQQMESGVVERTIDRIKTSIGNKELAWMFENCFPNALDAATALRVWQGISTVPWSKSHTMPMVFCRAMAAASQACRAVPPRASTTAAEIKS